MFDIFFTCYSTHNAAYNMGMNEDPRRQRTLQVIQSVFFKMVVEKRYHEIKVDDIISASGVARSTFYGHFASKDALLAHSLYGPFSILASCVEAETDHARVMALLEHFWQNQGLARTIMTGEVRRKTSVTLAGLIEKHLKKSARQTTIPIQLASSAIADMQLALISEWLLGRAVCSPEKLACALHSASRAMFRN